MFTSKEDLHIQALKKSEDSANIKSSMTVVRLGFVTTMLVEM